MDLKFETRYVGEPTVPIRVRGRPTGMQVTVDAVIDTGSNVTMLESWLLEGLQLQSAVKGYAEVTGVGGVLSSVAVAEVELEVLLEPELRVVVDAASLPADAPPVGNLIGTDVLDQLDFCLSHARQTLYFGVQT